MTFHSVVSTFANDWYLKTAFDAILVDFVLGVLAAARLGTFRLTYLANFARNDLSKVLAWAAVYIGALYAPAATVIGVGDVGVGFDDLAKVIWGIVVAALIGSIMSSLSDLGLSLPNAIAGKAPNEPQPLRPGYTDGTVPPASTQPR